MLEVILSLLRLFIFPAVEPIAFFARFFPGGEFSNLISCTDIPVLHPVINYPSAADRSV